MGRPLTIFPDALRLERALALEAARADFVDASAFATLAELVRWCAPPPLERRGLASAMVIESVLHRLAVELGREVLGASASRFSFARQVRGFIEGLEEQAVLPGQLHEAAEKAGSARARGLARLWSGLYGELERLGLETHGQRLFAAHRRLQHGLPSQLLRFEGVQLRNVQTVSVAELQLLQALAERLEEKGRSFSWEYIQAAHPSLDALMGHLLRSIERDWQHLSVDLSGEIGAGSGWLAEAIVDGAASPRPARVEAFTAPTSTAEQTEVARRVRRLIRSGMAPERIAIVARNASAGAAGWRRTFERHGLPLRTPLKRRLAETPLGRFVHNVAWLAERRFEAPLLRDVLASRYARGAVTFDVLKVFAEAGLVDAERGAEDGRDAYDVRLEAHALRQRAEAEREAILALRSRCRQIIKACGLTPQGTYLGLLNGWWSALEQLQVIERIRGDQLSADEPGAIEQLALERLERLVVAARDTLRQAGLADQLTNRAVFLEWLDRQLDVELELPAPRAGAVWLIDVVDLAGLSFDEVFVVDVADGRFPSRAGQGGPLGEDEQATLNAAAQRQLFRLGVSDGVATVPTALAVDRMALYLACASAPSLTFSAPRADDDGRELAASPFLEALERVVEGLTIERRPASPLVSFEDCELLPDLRARLSLEVLSPGLTRQSARTLSDSEASTAFSHEAWWQEAAHVGAIELERARFFGDLEAQPGPYSGLVGDGSLFQPFLRFDGQHPVSAAELGDYGTCHFKGLAKRLVGLETHDAVGEDLSRRDTGSFWHRVLEEAVPALQAAGLAQRGSVGVAELRPVVEEAVERVGKELEKRKATGHKVLWRLAKARAVRLVSRFLASEVAWLPGLRAQAFEHRFGSEAPLVLPGLRPGESDIALHGSIDRVDAEGDRAVAIDYKRSGASAFKAKRALLLVTDFQLPLYAYALRASLGARQLDAAWLGIKKRDVVRLSEVLEGTTMDELLDVSLEGRARAEAEGKQNLANAVHGLAASLRGGDFGPRSHDCMFCSFAAVCRVGTRALQVEG